MREQTPREEALAYLMSGRDYTKTWNRLQGKKFRSDIIDLKGADFRKCPIWDADLEKYDLSRSSFTKCELHNLHFSGAVLHGANFSRAYVEGTCFADSNLTETDFSGAQFSSCDFFGSDLGRANLKYVYGARCSFEKARCRGSHLSFASLVESNIRSADMSDSHMFRADLSGVDGSGVKLCHACLEGANLSGSCLVNADLSGADLSKADLSESDLSGAILKDADLSEANLSGVCLSGADLSGAYLEKCILSEADIRDADLSGCHVYGIAAWNLMTKGARQTNLTITPDGYSPVTVDNLEVAQFIYLLLANKNVRDIINTITSKVVLILGRFTSERKRVLDELREELRKNNYCPVVFDFHRPVSRDTHETVTTLARLARFVIADITDPLSVPQELVSIVESLPSVPVQPLLESGASPWGMYDHIARYPSVLPILYYESISDLLGKIPAEIITPAEQKAKESELRS